MATALSVAQQTEKPSNDVVAADIEVVDDVQNSAEDEAQKAQLLENQKKSLAAKKERQKITAAVRKRLKAQKKAKASSQTVPDEKKSKQN